MGHNIVVKSRSSSISGIWCCAAICTLLAGCPRGTDEDGVKLEVQMVTILLMTGLKTNGSEFVCLTAISTVMGDEELWKLLGSRLVNEPSFLLDGGPSRTPGLDDLYLQQRGLYLFSLERVVFGLVIEMVLDRV